MPPSRCSRRPDERHAHTPASAPSRHAYGGFRMFGPVGNTSLPTCHPRIPCQATPLVTDNAKTQEVLTGPPATHLPGTNTPVRLKTLLCQWHWRLWKTEPLLYPLAAGTASGAWRATPSGIFPLTRQSGVPTLALSVRASPLPSSLLALVPRGKGRRRCHPDVPPSSTPCRPWLAYQSAVVSSSGLNASPAASPWGGVSLSS
jgi:hypothetical protein